MEKTVFVFAFIFAFGFISLNAQVKINWGIKAEMNASNFLFDKVPGMKSNFGLGAGLGAFSRIDLGENFALQPELMFHWQNSTLKQSGVKSDFQYWGMEIPFYAIGHIIFDNNARIYVGLGPYLRLGFSAQNRTDKMNLYKGNETTDAFMQRGDIGAGVILGVEFPFGMQINASYKYGLLNVLNTPNENSVMSSQVISFGLGVRF